MSVPKRFLDDLRSRITLSEIIGQKLRLTRAGREYKACCPFHKEKTPSFYINDEKGFYHCFGCGAHGDAYGFLTQHDNLSFIDAVEMLAAQAGMAVPQPNPEERQRAEKEKDLYSLLDETTAWFEDQLTLNKNIDVIRYLDERGIDSEQRQAFRIGYAPENGSSLRDHLSSKGYRDDQMIEAGVMKKSTRGGAPYAFFRDRVMFPVPDRRGRVVAFGGRVLPDHIRPPNQGNFTPPKYINSSDTPLFSKGHMMYGEPHARMAASDKQDLIVVEGYLDVMACHAFGFKGAVAPLGTALTEEQIILLWAMIPEDQKMPILCFDGDSAGQRAAARACERALPLLKAGQSLRFAFLPEGEDPDSLLKSQGKAAFEKILKSAMNLPDFLWMHHMAGKTFDTPESRAGLMKSLNSDIQRITDRDLQYHYSQHVRNKMSETFYPRKNNQNSPTGRQYNKAHKPTIALPRPANLGTTRMRERILLALILNHPALFDHIEDELGQIKFNDPRFDQLRQECLFIFAHQSTGLETQALRTHLVEKGFQEELDMILSAQTFAHARFAKADAGLENARKGWQDIIRLMENQAQKHITL